MILAIQVLLFALFISGIVFFIALGFAKHRLHSDEKLSLDANNGNRVGEIARRGVVRHGNGERGVISG